MLKKIFVLAMCLAPAMPAGLLRIELAERSDVLGGKAFGAAGPYERLIGRAYFAVDPKLPANKIISDIDKAPRNDSGLVEFSSDIYVLKPRDPKGPRRGSSSEKKPEPTPLARTLRLLASRERTVQELDRALRQKGVEPDDRAAALARVKELGYIDDAAVAKGRALRRISKGESPGRVAQRLTQQGVAAGVAKAAAVEATAGRSEARLAQDALEKRLRGRPVRDEKERQRLLRFLLARGHRTAAAFAAMKALEAMPGAAGEADEPGTDGTDDATDD